MSMKNKSAMFIILLAGVAAISYPFASFGYQLQPIENFKPIETYKDSVSCVEKDCLITRRQIGMLDKAMALYEKDMPAVTGFKAQLSSKNGLTIVTMLPDEGALPSFSTPGRHMAVTYVFDTAGGDLIKRIFNR